MKHKKNITQNHNFMVYGLNGCISILNSSSCSIEKIIISDNLKLANSHLGKRLKKYNNKISVLANHTFSKEYHAYRAQGIIIYFNYTCLDSIQMDRDSNHECYLILDSIKDPQNLGQIIRTSECAGISGIIFPERRSVGITNAVLQVSQGAFCNMDLIQAKNIKYAIKDLKEIGFWIAGIENSIEAKDWYDIDMNGKIAFVMGSEGEGIRPVIKKYCDYFATIPMHGKSNSLNVSAAVSAILFERNRQISTKK